MINISKFVNIFWVSIFSIIVLGCSQSLESEVKETPISHFIRVNDDISLEDALNRYKYKSDVKFKYQDAEMSEYVFILLDLDLKNKEYREIIKTDPEKVKSGVILKIAKTKTRSPRVITLFPSGSMAFYAEVGEYPVEINLDDKGSAIVLKQIYDNVPIDIRNLPRIHY